MRLNRTRKPSEPRNRSGRQFIKLTSECTANSAASLWRACSPSAEAKRRCAIIAPGDPKPSGRDETAARPKLSTICRSYGVRPYQRRGQQTGRRPVVVVSHDGSTPGWNSIVAVSVSPPASQARRGPTIAENPAGRCELPKVSLAVCHQVTTMDRAKLTKWIGVLPADVLHEVELGLKAAMDLD